jgi:hypothetical protein
VLERGNRKKKERNIKVSKRAVRYNWHTPEHVGTTGHHLAAGTALPDADGRALHGGLAAEAAVHCAKRKKKRKKGKKGKKEKRGKRK